MVVDTIKENLCVNKLVATKKEVILVEGDMIVPDSKPDILNTICTSGVVCIYKKEVLELKNQVTYQDGQVASKTLIQNDGVGLTLFAFAKDEGISTHESKGDAIVNALEGVGRITIDGVDYILHAGESIVMPANHPHAVYGIENFKMLLIVTFPEKEASQPTVTTEAAQRNDMVDGSLVDGMTEESHDALKAMVDDSTVMIKDGRF